MMRSMRVACLAAMVAWSLACTPGMAAGPKKTPEQKTALPDYDAVMQKMYQIAFGGWEKFSDCSETNKNYVYLTNWLKDRENDSSVLIQHNDIKGLQSANIDAAGYNKLGQAALDKGCTAMSRKLFLHVIETYTGTAYAAVRQRAQIGIDDVRAAMAAPPKSEAAPAQTPPAPSPTPAGDTPPTPPAPPTTAP